MARKFSFFLNRNNSLDGFRESTNGAIFVDKSMLLDFVNSKIATKEKWICVSRARRFGKTMALEMLAAYYTKGIDSDIVFHNLNIQKTHSYYKHVNNHNTIYMNFNDYFENCDSVKDAVELLSDRLILDLNNAYPNVLPDNLPNDMTKLSLALDMIQQSTGEKFIFLIDEWDCIFRFKKGQKREQELFLSFLKLLFKDKSYLELVYMTGILPIKKYNTGSALNMFREYTMLEPKRAASFFGFTEQEIAKLCRENNRFHIDPDELKQWYDGYYMKEVGHIYNPRSVVEALEEGQCRDYWNRTGGYSELEEYISMNFDGLGDAVTALLSGEQVSVNVLGFSNDLDSFQDKDEVITALIHLGYLTYENGTVRIPNREIREEFGNTVKKLSWGIVSQMLIRSKDLLKATLAMDERKVASELEGIHDGMHEFKEYNNEHTLKCVIHLAYYAALDDYELQFEQPSGKGYADCIMRPRVAGKPAIILELKYDDSAEAALQQIQDRHYVEALPEYVRKVVLVGINYRKQEKNHECKIIQVER